MDVTLGTCIVIIIAFAYIFAIAGLRGGFFERFDESPPGNATTMVSIDDTVWDAIMPLSVDVASNPTPTMMNAYFVGDNPKDLEQQIQAKLKTTKEIALFPTEDQLNSQYYWLAYKPNIIHRTILDKVIYLFMTKSDLYNMNYYVANSRITHANVSDNNDLLLTMQLILLQESVSFAKVFEFQVLYLYKSKQCYFNNVQVVGVVHEQFISKPWAIVNGKSDFKAI